MTVVLNNEIMEKTEKTTKVIDQVKVPVLVVHSDSDKVADFNSSKKFFEQVS